MPVREARPALAGEDTPIGLGTESDCTPQSMLDELVRPACPPGVPGPPGLITGIRLPIAPGLAAVVDAELGVGLNAPSLAGIAGTGGGVP